MAKRLNRNNLTDESMTSTSTNNPLTNELRNLHDMKMRKGPDPKTKNKIRSVNIPNKLRGVLPTTELRKMFVDMCFFARLGFIQPPCCLKCAFVEAKESSSGIKTSRSKKVGCSSLVVWRYNANMIIHPDTLDTNIICIKCETARAWLRGESVQGLRWDAKSKRVVSVKTKWKLVTTPLPL